MCRVHHRIPERRFRRSPRQSGLACRAKRARHSGGFRQFSHACDGSCCELAVDADGIRGRHHDDRPAIGLFWGQAAIWRWQAHCPRPGSRRPCAFPDAFGLAEGARLSPGDDEPVAEHRRPIRHGFDTRHYSTDRQKGGSGRPRFRNAARGGDRRSPQGSRVRHRRPQCAARPRSAARHSRPFRLVRLVAVSCHDHVAATAARHPNRIDRNGRRIAMSASAALDLASIPERIQSEVQRAIQRSIKGVEYIASSGPSLGSTPKNILHVRGHMNLYHYRPIADEIYRVPILIVMATTNRGYILDMVPGQSFIEFLLKRGYDVYMLDWTPPKPEEKGLRMEDYVLDFIPDCIRRVQQDSGEQDVSVIGYCFGGVLSVLYGSIFHDGPMKNLICFTTPIDFREMKLFSNFSDRRYFDVDKLVDSVGNVPGDMIMTSFDMLRPASRAAGQVQLWENIWNDEYVKSYRMFDRWATDTLPLAGEYFRQITKELMWDNKLYNDVMSVGGRKADISKIKVPILHAVAEHDHIVPYDAAKPLIEKIGSADKEEVMLKGGHVSLVAGANAIKRLWPKLDSWLGERST